MFCRTRCMFSTSWTPRLAQTSSPQPRPAINCLRHGPRLCRCPIVDASVLFEEKARPPLSTRKRPLMEPFLFWLCAPGTYLVRARKGRTSRSRHWSLGTGARAEKAARLGPTIAKPIGARKKAIEGKFTVSAMNFDAHNPMAAVMHYCLDGCL